MVAFSAPSEFNMYIITTTSYGFGLTDHISVHFFSSIEKMWKQIESLMSEVSQRTQEQMQYVEHMRLQEVYRQFV